MKIAELLIILVAVVTLLVSLRNNYLTHGKQDKTFSMSITVTALVLGLCALLGFSFLQQTTDKSTLPTANDSTEEKIACGLGKILSDCMVRQQGALQNDDLLQDGPEQARISLVSHGRTAMDTFNACNTLYRHMLTVLPGNHKLERLVALCRPEERSACSRLMAADSESDLVALKMAALAEMGVIAEKALALQSK